MLFFGIWMKIEIVNELFNVKSPHDFAHFSVPILNGLIIAAAEKMKSIEGKANISHCFFVSQKRTDAFFTLIHIPELYL